MFPTLFYIMTVFKCLEYLLPNFMEISIFIWNLGIQGLQWLIPAYSPGFFSLLLLCILLYSYLTLLLTILPSRQHFVICICSDHPICLQYSLNFFFLVKQDHWNPENVSAIHPSQLGFSNYSYRMYVYFSLYLHSPLEKIFILSLKPFYVFLPPIHRSKN